MFFYRHSTFSRSHFSKMRFFKFAVVIGALVSSSAAMPDEPGFLPSRQMVKWGAPKANNANRKEKLGVDIAVAQENGRPHLLPGGTTTELCSAIWRVAPEEPAVKSTAAGCHERLKSVRLSPPNPDDRFSSPVGIDLILCEEDLALMTVSLALHNPGVVG